MKEFKGTPAPWEANGLEVETEDYYICSVADFRLDERFDIFDAKPISEAKAISESNSMLIAAAPELLSVLQKIVESGHILPHLKIESQWAIAKALGESK